MKKYVGNMKEYVENMKKYVENMNEYPYYTLGLGKIPKCPASELRKFRNLPSIL